MRVTQNNILRLGPILVSPDRRVPPFGFMRGLKGLAANCISYPCFTPAKKYNPVDWDLGPGRDMGGRVHGAGEKRDREREQSSAWEEPVICPCMAIMM